MRSCLPLSVAIATGPPFGPADPRVKGPGSVAGVSLDLIKLWCTASSISYYIHQITDDALLGGFQALLESVFVWKCEWAHWQEVRNSYSFSVCVCVCVSRPGLQFSLSPAPKRQLNKLLFLCIKSVERYVIGNYFSTVCVRCASMYVYVCVVCGRCRIELYSACFYSPDLAKQKKKKKKSTWRKSGVYKPFLWEASAKADAKAELLSPSLAVPHEPHCSGRTHDVCACTSPHIICFSLSDTIYPNLCHLNGGKCACESVYMCAFYLRGSRLSQSETK